MNPPVEDYAARVDEIRVFLEALPTKLPRGRTDREWTTEIKHGICNIGLSAQLLASVSGYPKPDNKEWLYDLIWFRNSDKHHLEKLVLVLESEWERHSDDILYDFEKLLVARAPIKVMVFQDHGNNLSQLWSMFETSIRTCRQGDGDELYLWAVYRESRHAFEFKQATRQEILSGEYRLS